VRLLERSKHSESFFGNLLVPECHSEALRQAQDKLRRSICFFSVQKADASLPLSMTYVASSVMVFSFSVAVHKLMNRFVINYFFRKMLRLSDALTPRLIIAILSSSEKSHCD
jgi:hypothetical protein